MKKAFLTLSDEVYKSQMITQNNRARIIGCVYPYLHLKSESNASCCLKVLLSNEIKYIVLVKDTLI